ncbi:MAG TPA: hypothetical protein DIT64_22865 [Verrucomicrobiales bacterium]|nr:hypothetical protein [Verrucomicrobiales bacterium]
MRHFLHKAGDSLLDLFYPRGCFACDALLGMDAPAAGDGAWLCSGCLETVVKIEAPYCSVCGEAFDGALTAPFRCWNCEERKLDFDFALSACKAGGAVRDMIHAFKYHRNLAMRAPLADMMLPVFQDPRLAAEDLSQWLLMPVPLHPLRWIWRGYNQSAELCRMLSRHTGMTVAHALARIRLTRPQAGLERRSRLKNLRGIFRLRRFPRLMRGRDLKGKNIFLVDDVLTTGATTHECARVLKRQAGVEKVVVITAARG